MDRKESMRRTVGLIVKTEVLFHRLLERQVSHTGVFPSQHRLLMELDRNPACAQMELAEKFGVSAAAITVSLKKLEKGGYIRRKADREDGRVNHVEITPEGKAVVGQSLRLFEEADELLFAGFGDDEVEALVALLSRAKENLEREEARQREPDGGK